MMMMMMMMVETGLKNMDALIHVKISPLLEGEIATTTPTTTTTAPKGANKEDFTTRNTQLNATAAKLATIKAEIARLEKQESVLVEEIQQAMEERGAEVLEGEGWKASWKNVNSSRFDSKAFRSEHADLYKAFCKPTTTVRFLFRA